jgi:GNAT superfamily N-acetyltransferase
MQVDYLADHPEFIAPLAQGLLEHYRRLRPEDTIQTRTAKLRTHLQRDTLPIAWVAHAEEDLLGTAALRVHDLEGREDLTPWLGGVFVLPPHRRRGIGQALCAVVEEKAASLGVSVLHLFTLDRQAWYARLGWSLVAPCTWRGHPGSIMCKRLPTTSQRMG